jgi:hypothetical protein
MCKYKWATDPKHVSTTIITNEVVSFPRNQDILIADEKHGTQVSIK